MTVRRGPRSSDSGESLNWAGGFSPSFSRSLGWTHVPSSSPWRSWSWPCREPILRSGGPIKCKAGRGGSGQGTDFRWLISSWLWGWHSVVGLGCQMAPGNHSGGPSGAYQWRVFPLEKDSETRGNSMNTPTPAPSDFGQGVKCGA